MMRISSLPTVTSISNTDQFCEVSQLSQFFWQRNQFVVAGDQNLQRKTADDRWQDRQLVSTDGDRQTCSNKTFHHLFHLKISLTFQMPGSLLQQHRVSPHRDYTGAAQVYLATWFFYVWENSAISDQLEDVSPELCWTSGLNVCLKCQTVRWRNRLQSSMSLCRFQVRGITL